MGAFRVYDPTMTIVHSYYLHKPSLIQELEMLRSCEGSVNRLDDSIRVIDERVALLEETAQNTQKLLQRWLDVWQHRAETNLDTHKHKHF